MDTRLSELSSKGFAVWNEWANEQLSTKPDIFRCSLDSKRWTTVGKNAQTNRWLKASKADFSDSEFERVANFSNFTFPADVTFENAKFSKRCSFVNATFLGATNFRNAVFEGDATFNNCRFLGHVDFSEATFRKYANFLASEFCVERSDLLGAFRAPHIRFGATRFEKLAFFNGARFSGVIRLDGCEFLGEVGFLKVASDAELHISGTKFNGSALFLGSHFENDFRMASCTFSSFVNFENVKFGGRAEFLHIDFQGDSSFASLRSDVLFSLEGTRFAFPPDFRDSSFHRIPRLDDVFIAEVSSLDRPQFDPRPRGCSLFRVCRTEDYQGYLHVLRRLAAESNDTERATEYFAQQIKARRFWHDQPFAPSKGMARFWLGFFYEKLSDFGRSVWRPFFYWTLLMCLFAVYFAAARDHGVTEISVSAQLDGHSTTVDTLILNNACVGTTKRLDAISEAFYLSFRNGLVFMPADRSESGTRALGCLYGFNKDGNAALIPLSVSLLMAVQAILSGILIFLLLLGVRNLLRMA